MLHIQRADKSGQYLQEIRDSLMSYYEIFCVFDTSHKRELEFVIGTTQIREVCECLGLPLSESRNQSPEDIVKSIAPHREHL